MTDDTSATAGAGLLSTEQIADEIRTKVARTPVLLFMKGTPDQPYCGFSARTVQALDGIGASFSSVDVLADPRIRQELTKQSNWPTVPQLFVDGTLVGGCDIVTELAESGELAELIAGAGRTTG